MRVVAGILMAIGGNASAASAATLLVADLTTPNRIEITATSGTSAATASGFDGVGVLLADFLGVAAPGNLSDSLLSGDITSAQNTADGTPNLFTSFGSFGLNLFSYTDDDPSSFVAGERAFSGSGVWTVNAADYANAVNGPTSGSIFAFADDDGDVPGATLIGEWQKAVVIPLPAGILTLAGALAGLGVLGARRRRVGR